MQVEFSGSRLGVEKSTTTGLRVGAELKENMVYARSDKSPQYLNSESTRSKI